MLPIATDSQSHARLAHEPRRLLGPGEALARTRTAPRTGEGDLPRGRAPRPAPPRRARPPVRHLRHLAGRPRCSPRGAGASASTMTDSYPSAMASRDHGPVVDALAILVDHRHVVEVQAHVRGLVPPVELVGHGLRAFRAELHPVDARHLHQRERALVGDRPDHRLDHGQVGDVERGDADAQAPGRADDLGRALHIPSLHAGLPGAGLAVVFPPPLYYGGAPRVHAGALAPCAPIPSIMIPQFPQEYPRCRFLTGPRLLVLSIALYIHGGLQAWNWG